MPSAANASSIAEAFAGLTRREISGVMAGRAISRVTEETLTCSRDATAEQEATPMSNRGEQQPHLGQRQPLRFGAAFGQ